METLPWFWIWVVLAALLCIGEMLTTSFYLLPFAIGAGVAAIANVATGNLVLQWVLFVVVSVIALIAMRPLANRITRATKERSGVERLIGMGGEIVAEKAPAGLQRVRVEREVWNAAVRGGVLLAPGTHVTVVEIGGTYLVVMPGDLTTGLGLDTPSEHGHSTETDEQKEG
ncbi:MAG: NfeD family protein [Coriobacteriales bacterium]|jgi:membrane protein implicated in regulation of membrane protease activity|nr:NfeD family protein [Coriobacteriales bacterium]